MAKTTDIPEAARRFGWQDGDLEWLAQGEGEPLFTEEELQKLLEENPTISQRGGDEEGEAEDQLPPVPLDPDLLEIAEHANQSNIIQEIYEEQAERNEDRPPWKSPRFE